MVGGATSPSCILSSTIPLTHLVSLPRCSKYTRTFHVPAVLCVSQLARSPICYARELFQTPISSSLLNSLLQFAYCCIINHLRVSGVTQGPFYLAHRLSVCQEFGWAVLLLQCLGPQLGRLTKLEGDVQGWEWNPLWRFFTHVWRLGCEDWTAGSAGIVG